jgi:hypothetical protein
MDPDHGQSRLQPTGDAEERSTGGALDWSQHRRFRSRAAGWGVLTGSLLVGLYGATLAVANSPAYLVEEFLRLWFWIAPLVLGFSLQVGLFVYARAAARAGRARAPAHGIVASGGATTVSMVACCAHHIADVLPVIGLAGAATLLATYQGVLLLVGVLSNLVGIIYVLGLLREHGLYPSRASLLSLALRWPVDRALGPAIGLALVVVAAVLVAGVAG